MRRFVAGFAITWTVIFAVAVQAQDDVPTHRLYLKSGGEILGQLINESKVIEGRAHLVFRTDSGGTLQLEKTAMVDKVEPLLDNATAAYQRLLAAANDPESHWEAVNWCKTQKRGNVKYRNEINFHLRQIVKLDPNDKDAWRRIVNSSGKPIYKEENGEWINRFEKFNSSGYIKHDRSWTSTEAIRVKAMLDQRNDNEIVVDAMGKWKDLIRDNKIDQARARLGQIIDDSTVVPLFNFVTGRGKRGRQNPQPLPIQVMVMEAIGNISSASALNALVYFAVEGANVDIRSRASTLLENERLYDPDAVAAKVVASNYLRATNNLTINRAALLLRRVGSDQAIVPLISALETEHVRLTGNRPGSISGGQRNGQIESFNVGGGKAQEEVLIKNEQVHSALRVLSNRADATKRVDFGYNKRTWKSWYVDKYTLTDMNVRADDE
jgi:hypothetical protein